MKWTHLTTAPDQITAEIWINILSDEGIPAIIEPGDTSSFMGLSGLSCRIMAPPEMVDKALSILATIDSEEDAPLE